MKMARGLRRKPTSPGVTRVIRVQARDDRGRFIDEWLVEVVPSGDDRADGRRAVQHLRDLMVWGPQEVE